MTTFAQFAAAARMRHDFADQIMVRYSAAGEDYDTWVSGEEVLSRLKSEARERQIKGLSRLDWDELKEAGEQARDAAEKEVRRSLKERLADAVEEAVGDNIIGDSLADNIRGVDSNEEPRQREKAAWQARLRQPAFREKVLELAWTNLRGSLPAEEEGKSGFDDWV